MGRKWDFVKVLRAEPYVICLMLASSLKTLSVDQLFQDKICLQTVEKSPQLCSKIATLDVDIFDDEKNLILATTSTYKTYEKLLTTVPGIVTALFVGAWSDQLASGRKILMIVNAIGLALDALAGLINVIWFELPTDLLLLIGFPYSLVGGSPVFHIAASCYIIRTSTDETRVLRFAINRFSQLIGNDIGTLLGGYLLPMVPWFGIGQVRNYFAVFLLSFVFSIISLIWVLIMINEKEDRKLAVKPEEEEKRRLLDSNSNDFVSDKKWYEPFKSVFNVQNVISMFKVTFGRRADGNHWTVRSMCLMYTIGLISLTSIVAVQFQFVQKTLLWDATFYGNVHTLISVFTTAMSTLAVYILSRKLHISDSGLCVWAQASQILAYTCRGTFLTTPGFVLSTFIDTLGGTLPVTVTKSAVAQIVPKDETGSIFSVLATTETLVTLFGTYLGTSIFKATIDFMPGLVYQVIAGLLFVPFIYFVWYDTKRAN